MENLKHIQNWRAYEPSCSHHPALKRPVLLGLFSSPLAASLLTVDYLDANPTHHILS